MAREASVAKEGLDIFTIYNLPEPTEGDFDALIYKGPTIAEIETFLSSNQISRKSFNNAIIYSIVLKDIVTEPEKKEQFEAIFQHILKIQNLRFADLKLINEDVQAITHHQPHFEETELKLTYLNNQALIFMIRANLINKVYETLNSVDSIKIQKETFFHALAFPFIAHFFSEGDQTEYNKLIEEAKSVITELFKKADVIIFAPKSGFLEHLETESLKQLSDPKKSLLPDYVFSTYKNNKDDLIKLFRNSVTKEAYIAP